MATRCAGVTSQPSRPGTAELFGHDQQKQAAHIIEHAAHPDVRDELWEDAISLGLA